MEDKLVLGGKEFSSRFILGSGKYNINLIKAAVEQGGAEIITLALRRANTQEKENILDNNFHKYYSMFLFLFYERNK